MKLTEDTIKAIQPEAGERVYWDDGLPGFGLRVQPSGKRSFIVMYRTPGGRRGRVRKVTIGAYGTRWTYSEARKEAKRLLAQVEMRKDPAAERRAFRDALTVAELSDLYFAEGCSTKKPSTVSVDKGRVERHIKPRLGNLKVHELTRADIERFLRDIAAGKTAVDVKTKKRGRAIVSGGKGTATRTVGLLGGMLTFAVGRGLRADNPVHGVKRYPDSRGDRFLSMEEWRKLGDALTTAQEAKANPTALAIIRALALTGARKSEIVNLLWSEVDVQNACLRLGDSKTGAKIIPLGAPALLHLTSQEAVEGCPYVFPAERSKGPYRGVERVWRQVRDYAEMPDLRMHDVRHAFASQGLAAGVGLPIIGALLGHRDVKTTGRYAHLQDHPVKRAATRIAKSVSAALG